eukprot:11001038-Lingulodinium_polyedra.AAC.1
MPPTKTLAGSVAGSPGTATNSMGTSPAGGAITPAAPSRRRTALAPTTCVRLSWVPLWPPRPPLLAR